MLEDNPYDKVADEYRKRIEDFSVSDLIIVGSISTYLRQSFKGLTPQVLEIGGGAGLNSRMLYDEGFTVVSIEKSARMVQHIREIAPGVVCLEEDFLEWNSGQHSFHGIFQKAVLHLFPLDEARKFLLKCRNLLLPNGILYGSVTGGEVESEAFLPKADYEQQVTRFKRIWTPEAIQRELSLAGLTLLYCTEKQLDPRGKRWIDFWAVRQE